MFPEILWKNQVFGSLVNNFKEDLESTAEEIHMIWLWPLQQVYHKFAQQTALRFEKAKKELWIDYWTVKETVDWRREINRHTNSWWRFSEL